MAGIAKSQAIDLSGRAGRLEALMEAPADGNHVGGAVICHPHPLHGGTLRNKVVHTLARAFVSQGFIALRFNFRGVENSAGEFDDGVGELDDVFTAMDYLSGRFPGLPLWLGGFSFGAALAVHAAAEREVAGLVSIAPAVTRLTKILRSQPDCPWLIVQGDRDELVDADDTIAWVNQLDPGPELQIIAGAEHFFHGKLIPLREAVETFIAARSQTPNGV